MNGNLLLAGLVLAAVSTPCGAPVTAAETPTGQGMSEANKERLVLDDMEDVSDWYNGSPQETTISASDRHVKQGRRALRFANLVDHTRGEKNYPIGWPRTGKDLASLNVSDFSGYDFFECWVYAETSRPALPKRPLAVGFYHSGPKRSTAFPLGEIKQDAWVKVVIPVARLMDPKDVQRVQFNINESDYKHGDRVDFYIDDLVLTRFVEPAVAEMKLGRKLLYSRDRTLNVQYKLVGRKDLATTRVELAIGRGDDPPVDEVSGTAVRQGEIVLPIDQPLAAGAYWAALGLRNARGELIDRKRTGFRVIAGPFDEE